jgi:16S rRNA (cytosine967-C5)-methyltransferase
LRQAPRQIQIPRPTIIPSSSVPVNRDAKTANDTNTKHATENHAARNHIVRNRVVQNHAMPVSAARKIAFDILLKVESHGAYASDLLHAELSAKIKLQDAALATELTMGVLRNAGLLDFLIESYSRKRLAALDREVVVALRLGVYQIRFLERIPDRAAVNESVEMVKRARKRSAAPFVNAVLHRAIEDSRKPAAALIPENLPTAERLGILYSHPAWLVERWLEHFGESRTIALLETDNCTPETAGAFCFPSARETDAKELARQGVRLEPGRWLRDAFRVGGGNVSGSQAFRLGRVTIQDEASQIVPLLLGVEAGDSVLDLCAAPGGKTAELAREAGAGALVVASDVYLHRLRAMRGQMERLQLRDVRLLALDGTLALPFGRKFRRILVDAPCSGTGTLARNPEIRGRLVAADLAKFHARQTAMVRSAVERLEAGGRLVYSTCSLEAEENELVVEGVLREVDGIRRVGREGMIAAVAPHFVAGSDLNVLFDSIGSFRSFPAEHGTDGFFGVGIEKVA